MDCWLYDGASVLQILSAAAEMALLNFINSITTYIKLQLKVCSDALDEAYGSALSPHPLGLSRYHSLRLMSQYIQSATSFTCRFMRIYIGCKYSLGQNYWHRHL